MRTATHGRFESRQAVPSDIQIVTAPKFARLLKVPITTLKRLFRQGVLPDHLLRTASGKHWRVHYSKDEFENCRAALALWGVFRRKPRAARQRRHPGDLLSLVIELIDAQNPARQSMKDADTRVRATWDALQTIAAGTKEIEGIWWQKILLDNPNARIAGAFILRVTAVSHKVKHGRQPTARQLAEALCISERSLYRHPFGKDAMHVAVSDQSNIERSGRRKLSKSGDGEDYSGEERREEDYIDESDAERPPDERGSKEMTEMPNGFHEVIRKKSLDDAVARKLRTREKNAIALEWEPYKVWGEVGEMLCLLPSTNLNAKKLLASLKENDPASRSRARKKSGKARAAMELSESDPTFGSWCCAAYATKADGKIRWWLNFGPRAQQGIVDSPAKARKEILHRVERAKSRYGIRNLAEMVSDADQSGC